MRPDGSVVLCVLVECYGERLSAMWLGKPEGNSAADATVTFGRSGRCCEGINWIGCNCLGKGERCDESSRSSIQTKYVTQRSVVSVPQRSPCTVDYRNSSTFVPSRKYSVEFSAAFSASVLHSVNGYHI